MTLTRHPVPMLRASLAGLPLELKRQILQYLLTVEEPIYMKPPILEFPMRATFPGEKSGLHPSILRVSKLFSSEGLAILYSTNIFFFKTVRTLSAFVATVSRYSRHAPFHNLHRVKHVCLSLSSELLAHIVSGQFTPYFPNLKVVDINAWYFDRNSAPTRDRCMDFILSRMEEELKNRLDSVVRTVSFSA